jgi:hypothetical protein
MLLVLSFNDKLTHAQGNYMYFYDFLSKPLAVKTDQARMPNDEEGQDRMDLVRHDPLRHFNFAN